MDPAISRLHPLRQRLTLAAFTAFALVPAAAAEITMRDAGDGGLVFSNLEGSDAPRAAEKKAVPRAVAPPAVRPEAMPYRRDRLAPLIAAAAHTHGLPEALLQAVIEVESNFNTDAVSPRGALGLMQLMPQTARQLGVADARDAAANIDGGARYLKQLLARFSNNLPLALAAYNAGPGAVQRSGAIPQYAETQRYVPRVLVRYHSLASGSSIR